MLRKFISDLLSAGLVDAVKMIAFTAIPPAISALISIEIFSRYELTGIKLWLIVSVASLIFLYFCIFIYENYFSHKPNFKPLNFDFRYEELNIEFKYIDLNNFVYSREKKIVALRDNINFFSDRFSWTGDKNIKIYCGQSHHKLVLKGKNNVWTRYEVDLRRSLKKDDKETVKVIWNLSDEDGSFNTFISVVIDSPTDNICLSLDSSSIDEKISKVFVDVSSHMGAEYPYKTEEIQIQENGRYEFSLEKPKLLHLYEMRWLMEE